MHVLIVTMANMLSTGRNFWLCAVQGHFVSATVSADESAVLSLFRSKYLAVQVQAFAIDHVKTRTHFIPEFIGPHSAEVSQECLQCLHVCHAPCH